MIFNNQLTPLLSKTILYRVSNIGVLIIFYAADQIRSAKLINNNLGLTICDVC